MAILEDDKKKQIKDIGKLLTTDVSRLTPYATITKTPKYVDIGIIVIVDSDKVFISRKANGTTQIEFVTSEYPESIV